MWKRKKNVHSIGLNEPSSDALTVDANASETYDKYPRYRDPYGETQDAIYAMVSGDPEKSFTLSELSTVAIEMGPVSPRDLAYSVAMGLEKLGLVRINTADGTVSLVQNVDATAGI